MFNGSSIIVGLEIGTSKVCAVVGEYNADGVLNIRVPAEKRFTFRVSLTY